MTRSDDMCLDREPLVWVKLRYYSLIPDDVVEKGDIIIRRVANERGKT